MIMWTEIAFDLIFSDRLTFALKKGYRIEEMEFQMWSSQVLILTLSWIFFQVQNIIYFKYLSILIGKFYWKVWNQSYFFVIIVLISSQKCVKRIIDVLLIMKLFKIKKF